jgi:hypothetical protein
VKRAVVAVLAGVALMVAGATPGSAASGWTVQKTPDLKTPNGSLGAVDCFAVDTCMAVGAYEKVGATLAPIAESWDGAKWKTRSAPTVSQALAVRLVSVSCPTAHACIAVGDAEQEEGLEPAPLAEHWDGSTWSKAVVPMPNGASVAALLAVDCSSANACVAVGGFSSAGLFPDQALAEAWNGTKWTVKSVPVPQGTQSAGLAGVSCSAGGCLAVGSYLDGSFDRHPLAEVWNGTKWTRREVPDPAGSSNSSLTGVSCTAEDACMALGTFVDDSFSRHTFTQEWNGQTWTAHAVPDPQGAVAVLSSLSCTAADACTAVGKAAGPATTTPLVETWDGQGWTAAALPVPQGSHTASFVGVSCSGATACVGVGWTVEDAVQLTLAETWNGSTWSRRSSPNLNGFLGTYLAGVSCVSSSRCVAVGTAAEGAFVAEHAYLVDPAPFAETWNGTSWKIVRAPEADGVDGESSLTAVSCVSATACTAVGSWRTEDGGNVLVETWNGTAWKIQNAPAPDPDQQVLQGVSCTGTSTCMAVGHKVNTQTANGTPLPLAQRRNGGGWSGTTVPLPNGAMGGSLTSVSCLSANACTAAGSWLNGSGLGVPLIETWNGTHWAIKNVPTPQDTLTSGLNGISCVSANACVAVGQFSTLQESHALVELWNGTKWSVVKAGEPSGSHGPDLYGVSCTAAKACTAVGTWFDNSREHTLAETWNGTKWSVQPSPNPPTVDLLNAVSCTSATNCTAVAPALTSRYGRNAVLRHSA